LHQNASKMGDVELGHGFVHHDDPSKELHAVNVRNREAGVWVLMSRQWKAGVRATTVAVGADPTITSSKDCRGVVGPMPQDYVRHIKNQAP
jgi:hypothetical protein